MGHSILDSTPPTMDSIPGRFTGYFESIPYPLAAFSPFIWFQDLAEPSNKEPGGENDRGKKGESANI